MHFSCIHILHLVALITIPLLTSMCSGPRAAAHEAWTITQLLTQGERVESVTEVVEVRNCGVAERKTVDCSAGTSNNFSTSLGLDLGLEAGIEVGIGPSIAADLGFNRSSGESLDLDTPPSGYINRYVVVKEYRIVSGKVLARSSTGGEQEAQYAFQASCSLGVESLETFECEDVAVPSPSLSCPEVSGPFADAWSDVQHKIGCAIDRHSTTWVAEEAFQNGWMYWRKDNDMIYEIYDSGGWGAYANTWREGDPYFSCPDADTPEESPPTPVMGFGKVWCNHLDVRQGLGWAMDAEHGFDAVVQDFEHGFMLGSDRWIWVFYDDDSWDRK